MPYPNISDEQLDALPQDRIAAAFLRRLSFPDATTDNPKRTVELIRTLSESFTRDADAPLDRQQDELLLAVSLVHLTAFLAAKAEGN